MNSAPLYLDVAEAPKSGHACWIQASDGVRLRFAAWEKGSKGTILIFSGRTEFIEKYGRVVGEFQNRGYACAIIDWRGQGLSDRLVPNRQLGYVQAFEDYQRDVAAMLTKAIEQNLPQPYFLLAHSMGGTIGFRSIRGVLPVKKAAFTAPLWGVHIDPLIRPIVQAVAAGTRSVGMGTEFAPGTGPENYVISNGFEDNSLTSDKESFAYLKRQMKNNPGLVIGGPSIHWLYEALTETRNILRSDPPALETLCLLGSDESVVDSRDVIQRMESWPGGRLETIKAARHEILMETPGIRKRAFDLIDGFFGA